MNAETVFPEKVEKVSWTSILPFLSVHLMCFAAFWTGVRAVDVAVCLGLYFARMLFLTTGYHRYFSHRTFKTSRAFQFVLALGGTLCVQKGVLWAGSDDGWVHVSKDGGAHWQKVTPKDLPEWPLLRFPSPMPRTSSAKRTHVKSTWFAPHVSCCTERRRERCPATC